MLQWKVAVIRWTCSFFQAEDGIRDLTVTGVQTCALPICLGLEGERIAHDLLAELREDLLERPPIRIHSLYHIEGAAGHLEGCNPGRGDLRSEERRVGKECRSRWSPYH